ncbi:hypothetical protein OED01_05540 [Microbacterium sp. M28]|uniref:ArnT family glycosyltransferase n=1 Tax=Microbacterium sp. M28 TaxID=2962064 RepID=UPI0021F3D42C|nr:hypothetical protein [Microbacterium sp. M28]UYO98172.1 hypothetical protein OED01_05540 [Microbacterium sp. M28]
METRLTKAPRLSRLAAPLLGWGLVALTFVASYAAFVRYQVFFSPDSRYYLAMAFRFSGDSAEVARERTVEFAAQYNVPVPPLDLLFGWGLVQPRVVLPTIAAPFVKLFGPFGLALTTLLITIALVVTMTVLLTRRYGWLPGVATVVLVNGSFYLMSFFGSMLTESLSALWTALALIAAWRWVRSRNVWWLVMAGGVTVLSAFTRQATLIVAGAFIVAWVLGSLVERRNSAWMWPAIVVTVASLGSQFAQMLIFPSFSQLDQFLRQAGADNLGGALLAVPRMVWNILYNDVHSMLRYDRILLFIVAIAVIGMVIWWRRVESHLLLGAILATGLYNVTNGTPTQFRYATPGVIFFIVVVCLAFNRLAAYARQRMATTAAELALSDSAAGAVPEREPVLAVLEETPEIRDPARDERDRERRD